MINEICCGVTLLSGDGASLRHVPKWLSIFIHAIYKLHK